MVMNKKKRWHCLSGQPITELDKQVMYWESKGKLVPTRDMIRTPEQIEGIRIAGKLNTGCLDAVADMIKPGISTQDIDDVVMQYCKDHDCHPSCLNYEGFPKAVCTSINEVVCHGIPKKEDILQPGDIVNVDMTLDYNGYYGDASRMFIIGGTTTPEKEQLVRVTKECLDLGAEAAKPWGFLGDIGHAIQKHAEKYGLRRGARPLRSRRRTGHARRTRSAALRTPGHRHAVGTRHDLHHRANDQHGDMESVYRRRRPLRMGSHLW